MALNRRTLSPEEHDPIETFAPSRPVAARLVERARLLRLANQGHQVPAMAQHLHPTAITVRTWRTRFNAAGLAALTDHQRSGRPATSTPPQVAEVSAIALTPPSPWGGRSPRGPWIGWRPMCMHTTPWRSSGAGLMPC
jgi:hypothetical protein